MLSQKRQTLDNSQYSYLNDKQKSLASWIATNLKISVKALSSQQFERGLCGSRFCAVDHRRDT